MNNEHAYFVLSQNQVSFSQTKGSPCLRYHFPFMPLSDTTSSQSLLVTFTKFLQGHPNFKNVYTMFGHFRHSNGFDLSFHAPAFELVQQLGIVGVDTEDVSGLRLVDSLKEGIQG